MGYPLVRNPAEEVGYDHRTVRELVKIDPKFFRAAEVDGLLGDASKARKILGWKQAVSFESMVEMMVKADIERVARGRRFLGAHPAT